VDFKPINEPQNLYASAMDTNYVTSENRTQRDGSCPLCVFSSCPVCSCNIKI